MKRVSALSRWSSDVAREMIRVIKAEERRRLRQVRRMDEDYSWDRWRDVDQPFINELCLMLLVAAWHRVEDQVVRLAARATADGALMPGDEYRARLAAARKRYKRREGREAITENLNLKKSPGWHGIETMRLIANCYKHDPIGKPDPNLLCHLKLRAVPEPRVDYASLPDSQLFREGLARSLGLKNGDYYEIVKHLLVEADVFIDAVEKQPFISPVKFGPISLSRFIG